jgi:diaminohydroxyphosphoribosylaminopyrimidine deaminase / 5-amino-6-(5-phosphoribosylamino)uracil reductase
MNAPEADAFWMRRALTLARRALGQTSPNPMVGAVLVQNGHCVGEGYHHQAGQPHAEIEALRDCARRGNNPRDTTLYVTLEPCSTQGRTPPCTAAVLEAGVKRVVVAATDPNPRHRGRGLDLLRENKVEVTEGVRAQEATELNATFNHWIVHRTPLVTLKAGMTLDGKLATTTGESRWITGEASRRRVMRLRQEHDAILIGIQTALTDDPSLTIRLGRTQRSPWRIVLDTRGRLLETARILTDEFVDRTLVVVGDGISSRRLKTLQRRASVLVAPREAGRISLPWLCRELGQREITGVLVEGGGEVHASFLSAGLAHRLAFFYAPKLLGGRTAPRAVAGPGFPSLTTAPRLREVHWQKLGPDLLLTARIESAVPQKDEEP